MSSHVCQDIRSAYVLMFVSQLIVVCDFSLCLVQNRFNVYSSSVFSVIASLLLGVLAPSASSNFGQRLMCLESVVSKS